jgi:hypothetical protein
MRTSQIRRRLDALSARMRLGSAQSFTLEGHCRRLWELDKRGFRSLVNKECPELRLFLEVFEPKEADRNHGGRTCP